MGSTLKVADHLEPTWRSIVLLAAHTHTEIWFDLIWLDIPVHRGPKMTHGTKKALQRVFKRDTYQFRVEGPSSGCKRKEKRDEEPKGVTGWRGHWFGSTKLLNDGSPTSVDCPFALFVSFVHLLKLACFSLELSQSWFLDDPQGFPFEKVGFAK